MTRRLLKDCCIWNAQLMPNLCRHKIVRVWADLSSYHKKDRFVKKAERTFVRAAYVRSDRKRWAPAGNVRKTRRRFASADSCSVGSRASSRRTNTVQFEIFLTCKSSFSHDFFATSCDHVHHDGGKVACPSPSVLRNIRRKEAVRVTKGRRIPIFPSRSERHAACPDGSVHTHCIDIGIASDILAVINGINGLHAQRDFDPKPAHTGAIRIRANPQRRRSAGRLRQGREDVFRRVNRRMTRRSSSDAFNF